MFSISYFPYTQVLAVVILYVVCFAKKSIFKNEKVLYYISVIGMALYPLIYLQNYFDIIGGASIFSWLLLLFCFSFKKYRIVYVTICSVMAIIFYFLFCSWWGTPIYFCWTISTIYVILLFYKFVYYEFQKNKKLKKDNSLSIMTDFEKIKKRYVCGEICESEYKKLKADLLTKL